MGQSIAAHLAYGIPIPANVAAGRTVDDIDEALHAVPGNASVQCLDAGSFDAPSLFLTAHVDAAYLGKPKTVHPQVPAAEFYAQWDARVIKAASTLGIEKHETPGWLLIADVS